MRASTQRSDELELVRQETLDTRMKILDLLASERGSRVITMMHRCEPWTAYAEVPSISIEDTESVLMEVRATPPQTPIDLILHTPGGLALGAELIAMALKAHPAKVTVIVPFYAMSGGTLIALAADEIQMESFSVLGPVDPQIAGIPSAALQRLVKRKPIQYTSDETLILADIARLAMDQTCSFVCWLLEDRMKAAEIKAVADLLVKGYLLHSTPITLELVRGLGLPAKAGIPDRVFELFRTCYQGNCLRPGSPLLAGNVTASVARPTLLRPSGFINLSGRPREGLSGANPGRERKRF